MPRRLLPLIVVLLSAALPFQGGAGTHAHACAHAAQSIAADDAGMEGHEHHMQHGNHAATHAMAADETPSASCDCGCDCVGHCGGLGTMAFSLPPSASAPSLHAAFSARAPAAAHASVHPALPLRPPISA